MPEIGGGLAARSGVRFFRRLVNRAGFDITREPYMYQFVRVLNGLGITEVVDVGANTGQYGVDLRDARFAGRIVSIEPLAAAFEELSGAASRDPGWECLRAAVSDAPGTVTINVAGNSVSSSVLPMLDLHSDAVPSSSYVATEEVDAFTTDQIVERFDLRPEAALLKLDVQGYESAVLAGARETLPRFAAVQHELSVAPLYEGSTLMPEMISEMADAGFDLWALTPAFIDPRTGRMLQFDGFFVRRDR